jgi:hypothetical protein
MNRSRPNVDDIDGWLRKRNTQCNFDTVLQIISLRSQPEVTKLPTKIEMSESEFEKFGFAYEMQDKFSYCWSFEFEIQHTSVFENGIVPLGSLYSDCDGVPMIVCGEQNVPTSSFLNTTVELKNIYFEIM